MAKQLQTPTGKQGTGTHKTKAALFGLLKGTVLKYEKPFDSVGGVYNIEK